MRAIHELVAIGRVGEDGDRVVQRREGGDRRGDAQQRLGGHLERLAEEIEGEE